MKRLTKVVKVVSVILIVLAITHGIATFLLGRKVEAEIKKIKAADAPVSTSDLAGPKVPDSENGAVVYAQAFAFLPKNNSPDELAIASILTPEEREKNPKSWSQAEAAMLRYQNSFPLVREAVSRPKCRFPVKWELGFAAQFPHFAQLRSVERFICAKAVLDARSGKASEAVKSLELGLRVSDSIKDEPTFIGALVRTAMINIAVRALSDIESNYSLAGADTRGLVSLLSEIDLSSSYQTGLKAERAMLLWTLDDIRKHGINYNALGIEPSNANPWLRLRGTYLGRPLLYLDELDYLKRMDKMMEDLNGPFRNANSQTVDSPPVNMSTITSFADLMCPAYSRAWVARDKCEASIRGSQILLALVAFKSRFGAYPNLLKELNTGLGWKVPLEDPFSGKDFIYKRQGKGFILYSIGPNLKDDGGREQRPVEQRRKDPFGPEMDDIVWRMDH